MAEAKIEQMNTSEYAKESHSKYSLAYENRSLHIYFNSDFPYEILGWEETYLSGFGEPIELTTKAKRLNTIKSAYWNRNSNADREIRKQLGLLTE